MGRFAGERHSPRSDISQSGYTPLQPSQLNSKNFIPSISVVKRPEEGNKEAMLFMKGVSKVVKNQRDGDKVKAKFSTPRHNHLASELVSQKKLAEQAQARGFTPHERRMRQVALTLRSILEEYYRDNPELSFVKLGEIKPSKDKRDKVVIAPIDLPEKEARFSRLIVAQEMPKELRLKQGTIAGVPEITIASTEEVVTRSDLEIIRPSIEEFMPETLTMQTVVQLHTGHGRQGVEEFPVAA